MRAILRRTSKAALGTTRLPEPEAEEHDRFGLSPRTRAVAISLGMATDVRSGDSGMAGLP